MDAVCTISDPPTAPTRTPGGGRQDKFPDDWSHSVGNPCSVTDDSERDTERPEAGAIQATGFYLVRLKHDAAVTTDSRLTMTACSNNPFMIGVVFYVWKVALDSTNTHRLVKCYTR
jgi:hypothetical protein